MRLRHGCDVRRYHDLRMCPERMAFRQRLGVSDIEDSCCKAAAVERLDECGLIELRAAADMQQSRSHRQKREEFCVQEAAGLLRQGQKTDENIRSTQETAQLIVAMKAGDAPDHLFAAAPCGKGKSKGLEAIDAACASIPTPRKPTRRSVACGVTISC